MKRIRPVVHVVDDDKLVREGLSRLLRSEGYDVLIYASATAFMEQRSDLAEPTCVVLDVMMPGMTGLELQDELRNLQSKVPVIFVSGQGSIPITVRALQGGATTFLEKPLDPDDLLEAVKAAVDHHATLIDEGRELAVIRRRVESLSLRERQVLSLVVEGLPNKQIATELKIAERTVKAHRAHVMKKMAVASVAELARIVEHIGGFD
jgi:FixJ family two-component response regulator